MRPERISSGPLARWWMMRGEWRAYPARAVLAGLAIAVGVALGFAVHLINASALNEFASAISAVNGEADLQVRAAGPNGFEEALYPRLARTPGVAHVSPVVEIAAHAHNGASVRLIGLDVLRAAAVTPALLGQRAGAMGGDPFDSQGVFLSPTALAATGARLGEPLVLAAGVRQVGFVVRGVLAAAPQGQSLAVADIAQVQWRFARLGTLDRVDLRIDQGADPRDVAARVAGMLPASAQVVTQQAQARRSDALSRAYRVNLDMLALMALMTGGFLVYSAQSLAVSRRRPQFALLRVLGVERSALLRLVVAEAAIVGTLGALAGLALGAGLAEAALRVFGGDLGGGYFSGERPRLALTPGPALIFLALGIAAALLGGLLPAREAGRAAPAVALKNLGDAVDPNRRPAVDLALTLLLAGAAAAMAPAVRGLPVFGYLSIALMLAGGVAATPWLARGLLGPLQGRAGRAPVIDLALKRLWGAPSQAGVALCSIVASTSLVVAMAVMVASFRGSVDEWLLQVLPADIYMRVEGASFEPAAQARIAAVPGVAHAAFLGQTSLRLAPDRPEVALIGQTIDPRAPGRTLPMIGESQAVPKGVTPVWVSEPAQWIYGYRPGQQITLPIGHRAGGEPLFVAGVWRDYARQHGAVALTSDDYTRLTGDAGRTGASIELAPGASADRVIGALKALVPAAGRDGLTIARPSVLRAAALATFDRSFAVTYLLEAVAVLVGLAGVAAALSAQTLARTKEFGMLRHIGVLRRQIIGMLATEGALLGLIGVIAGASLGLVMSQVLIHVVNPQSFHWTMQTRVPWGLLAGFAAALIACAAATALVAGRRAVSRDAVQAVREDW
ncbi:FtsX-like permease family protein [Phenylobacterium sp.]|uniref:FtsX-like permease family protein n=1 Tax=Phenylobacterium sp. TaxID=1871053 RepID=UPI002733EE1D|nr:FtsX family ABC transporter permease [Phenylobacterium sp.]MDP3659809.1 ABC transporter permease [Phenylobacterium sp.]